MDVIGPLGVSLVSLGVLVIASAIAYSAVHFRGSRKVSILLYSFAVGAFCIAVLSVALNHLFLLSVAENSKILAKSSTIWSSYLFVLLVPLAMLALVVGVSFEPMLHIGAEARHNHRQAPLYRLSRLIYHVFALAAVCASALFGVSQLIALPEQTLGFAVDTLRTWLFVLLLVSTALAITALMLATFWAQKQHS